MAELRHSLRARDDFIAIAAHELRNPMTPVIGVAELALAAARKAGGRCPPKVIELLERLQILIQDYMKRATRLLDITRIEAGKLQLEPAITDLSSLVGVTGMVGTVQKTVITHLLGMVRLMIGETEGIGPGEGINPTMDAK